MRIGNLAKALAEKKYQHDQSLLQRAFYTAERKLGHVLLRRFPPAIEEPRLLNLGCGPHIFTGWVNADDYAIKRHFRQKLFRPNWRLDVSRPWKCPENHWDGVFTEHVLEMLTYSDAVAVLRECFRTLKPGAILRISLPDLRKFVALYRLETQDSRFPVFQHPALAMSFLTQMHYHKSVWDADLMKKVLAEVGFSNAEEFAFREGRDARLLRDDDDKAHDSFYVEARKF